MAMTFETIERAAYDLRPFWVADMLRITGSVAGNAATSVSDPNAVYRDGSRSMTGDLNMGGNDVINVATVDGVDVSQLAADFAAHVVAADPHPQYAFDTNTVGAGAGLTGGGQIGSNPVLAVGAGNGMVVNPDDVALGTPSAVSATTANSVTGATHTHSVIYTTTGAINSLVGTDASGNITASGNLYAGNTSGTSAVVTPMRLDGSSDDLYLVNAVTDVTGRGRVIVRTRGEVDSLIVDGPSLRVLVNGTTHATLAVDALGNLDITPTGPLIRIPTTARVQTPNYASQTTGWAVSGAGEADFRYLYVDEMHAKSFIADLEQALAGGQIITKSVAVLGRAFTAPAISAGGAATFRASFGNAGTTNSLNVTGPAGVVNDDQMAIVVAWWNQTLTMPAGWTQIGNTQTISDGNGTRFARAYRRTAASEPGSYTFTLSSADDIEVAGVCYSGIDLTTPIDAFNVGRTNTASTQLRADEVTTVTAGAILLYLGVAMDDSAGAAGVTVPGGMTSRRNATNGTWVRCVVADEVRATTGATGARIATLTTAETSAGFLLALRPAPTNATTLWVRDLPSAPGMAAFQAGDIVRLRQFSRAGGGLSITDCWGAVTNYADGAGADEGLQSWTFTRSAPPNAGAMTEGAVVQPDAIVLDYGTTGNGFYEVNAIDGIYAQNSPYAQIVTWTGHPATGRVVRGRYGNLRGIFGAGDEYGLFAGSGVSNADAFLRLSNLGNRLNNIPIQLYNSGTQTVNVSATGTDVWIGTSTSDRRLNWNGTVLTVTGAINVQSISGLNYAGAPSPGGSANAIVGQGSLATQSAADWITQVSGRPGISGQGQLLTNAPGAPGSGLWITANYIGWHDGANWRTYVDNNGRFFFRGPTATALLWDGANLIGYSAGGVEQWRHSASTGLISAGLVSMGAGGINIRSTEQAGIGIGAQYVAGSAYKFATYDGSLIERDMGGITQQVRVDVGLVSGFNEILIEARGHVSFQSGQSPYPTVALGSRVRLRANAIYLEGQTFASGAVYAPVISAGGWVLPYTAWATYGVGDGGAAVYNDNGTYQALMVVGNTSGGGGIRRVQVWDELTINDGSAVNLHLSPSRAGQTWTALSYIAGWSTISGYNAAAYKRVGDLVFLRGTVQRTSGVNTVIATLPAGYRPVNRSVFPRIGGGDTVARVDVRIDGNIELITGSATYIALDGIVFSLI